MTNLAAISLAAPAFALGAALLVLPIAAHLLNRRARRRITFPSIELLAAASASQSSLFRMRRWWLLLLRCLALLAIVLAFMQPVWQSASAGQKTEPTEAVIIILDASASTTQLIGGIPAFQYLRAEADHVLDELTPGETLANVIYASARPQTVLPSITGNITALRAGVVNLEPTNERADMVGALALAGRILTEHAGPSRLVILTDLQQTNWTDTLDRLEADPIIPSDTRITFHAPPGPTPTNLSLHHPTTRPLRPRVGQPVSLGVTVSNHSDRIQSATVHASIAGSTLAPRSITIEPRQQREVIFTTTCDDPGEHRVEFTIPADALAIDNSSYSIVQVFQQTPIVMVSDDDTDQPGTAGYFLTRALAPYGDERDRYRVQRLHSADTFPPDRLGASAVFISRVGSLTRSQLTGLLEYIERGGGVVLFAADESDTANLQALDALKPGAVIPWKPEALRIGDMTRDSMAITRGDWRSPLLSGFGEAARLSLQDIGFQRAWTGGDVDINAQVLLRYDDQTPALISREVDAGRLMIANFSADQRHSDLGKHGLFVALIQSLADYLQNTNANQTDHTIGRTATLTTPFPIDRKGPAPQVDAPDNRTPVDVSLALGDSSSDIFIHWPTSPGFYTARQGDLLLGSIAINMDPSESDLKRINADTLAAAILHSDANTGMELTREESRRTHQSTGLWGWLLLIALMFLGTEMFLLGHWKR